jgi:hypothetical protein
MAPWDDWTGTNVPEADVMTRLARDQVETVIEAIADIRDSINELAKEMRTTHALEHETRTTIEAGLLEIAKSLNAICNAIWGGNA